MTNDQYGLKAATRRFWLKLLTECFWVFIKTSGLLFWGIVLYGRLMQ